MAITDNEANKAVFRHKKVKFPLLDKAMQLWVEQALDLPDDALKFSNRWVHKFKKRNNLRNYQLHEEANSTPLELLPEQRVSTALNTRIATTIRMEK
ncbi:26853_t:CDS:2, partial [Racocetra persica]